MPVSQPEKNLECYLVGGAVRDELLGLEVSDKDWVVVGSTPDQMLELGFTPIGKDFPVFLHPHTKEEYALARTERKSGVGYKGFTVYASPEVTLVEDLQRRDLTVNAIAKSIDGRIIDPFYGQDDLRLRTLRHVSPAFSEDPVRILRTARFAARYAELGFKIQNNTLSLMRQMVDNNEADALVAERVWQELNGALRTRSPSVFFITLRTCGALSKIFPEIDVLFGVPQTAEYHPEIDTGVHTMMVIDRARELSDDIDVLYAALTHDLGKGLTPKAYLPSHRGHEARGVPQVKKMSERIRAPKETARLAEITSEQHLNMHRLEALRPGTILKLLMRLDAFRKPDRVKKFGLACQADAQGRGGDHASRNYPQRKMIMEYYFTASRIDAGEIAQSQKNPKKIGAAIEAARVDAIRNLKQRHQPQIKN